MKKIIDTYRVFYPDVLSIAGIAVGPLVLLAILGILASRARSIVFVFSSAYLVFIGLLFDYFVFTGICEKRSSLRVFRCSLLGKNLLKRGLILNQIRRIIQIISIQMILAGICIAMGIASADIIGLALVLSFLDYLIVTAFLNVLRYIDNLQTYSLISMVVCSAATILDMVFYYQYLNGKLAGFLFSIIFGACSIMMSAFSVWHVLHRYRLGFQDHENGRMGKSGNDLHDERKGFV